MKNLLPEQKKGAIFSLFLGSTELELFSKQEERKIKKLMEVTVTLNKTGIVGLHVHCSSVGDGFQMVDPDGSSLCPPKNRPVASWQIWAFQVVCTDAGN